MGIHPEKKDESESVGVVAVKREAPVCEDQEGKLCEEYAQAKSAHRGLTSGCFAHLEQSVAQVSAECQAKKKKGERKSQYGWRYGGIRSHIGARSGTMAASACSNRAVLTNEQD